MGNAATDAVASPPSSQSKLPGEVHSTCVIASSVCNELQAPAAVVVDQSTRFPLLLGDYEAHTFDYNVR